jgi:hypothetical protein
MSREMREAHEAGKASAANDPGDIDAPAEMRIRYAGDRPLEAVDITVDPASRTLKRLPAIPLKSVAA